MLERDMPRFRCYDDVSDNTKSFTNTCTAIFLCSGHELSAKDFHSLCLGTHDVSK